MPQKEKYRRSIICLDLIDPYFQKNAPAKMFIPGRHRHLLSKQQLIKLLSNSSACRVNSESTKNDVCDGNLLLPRDHTKISMDFSLTGDNFVNLDIYILLKIAVSNTCSSPVFIVCACASTVYETGNKFDQTLYTTKVKIACMIYCIDVIMYNNMIPIQIYLKNAKTSPSF